jgi:HSP20 family protein
MTIGPDGRPRVREFGNVKSLMGRTRGSGELGPQITAGEIEPLVDITTTDKEVKVIVEMPGVIRENIKINAYDTTVEVRSDDPSSKKYHQVIDLPPEADIETAKSTYKNGILEITFQKKKQTKPKGKEVKVE